MDIMELGAIGELVGGLAVIGSLIYVALQVRENSSLIKRQALGSAGERFTTWAARVRDKPEILEIYLRGAEGFDGLDEVEQYRFHLTKLEVVGAIEIVLDRGGSNMIKPETANAAKRWLARELQGAGTRAWWNQMGRASFSDDFGAEVDRLFSQRSD